MTAAPQRPSLRDVLDPVVYFIQEETDGPIKIGYARDPYRRIRNLQNGNWRDLNYLGDIPGGLAEEQDLHTRFRHLRVRGEWFSPTPELLEHITALLANRPDRHLAMVPCFDVATTA